MEHHDPTRNRARFQITHLRPVPPTATGYSYRRRRQSPIFGTSFDVLRRLQRAPYYRKKGYHAVLNPFHVALGENPVGCSFPPPAALRRPPVGFMPPARVPDGAESYRHQLLPGDRLGLEPILSPDALSVTASLR